MNKKENLENIIIENYKQDEKIMILIFAQWCVNHNLDPNSIYQKAYGNVGKNTALQQAIESTVSKEEAEHISDDIVLEVLSMFGNDDLAFVVTEEIKRLSR